VEGGIDTPLGGIGLAVELHPLPWLVLAGGLGGHPNDSWTGPYDLQLALSSRFRVLSVGNSSLSVGLGFSRGDRPIERVGSALIVSRERVGAIRLNPELSARAPFRPPGDGAGIRRPRHDLDRSLRLLLVRPKLRLGPGPVVRLEWDSSGQVSAVRARS
jgi:hypothetical protein